jgi:hypothetical protein
MKNIDYDKVVEFINYLESAGISFDTSSSTQSTAAEMIHELNKQNDLRYF